MVEVEGAATFGAVVGMWIGHWQSLHAHGLCPLGVIEAMMDWIKVPLIPMSMIMSMILSDCRHAVARVAIPKASRMMMSAMRARRSVGVSDSVTVRFASE
jgi:hypothetical protein